MDASRRRLGRGLDGLLPPVAPAAAAVSKSSQTAAVEVLRPNRTQPRRFFDPEAISELAASIREHGVLEPILVRELRPGEYEIIAGERRYRAAKEAGLREVPIFIHRLNDMQTFEVALVENLQRQDLNPIETARAFARLVDDFGYSQDRIAERVGKNRSSVANSLRLLKLPEEVLGFVESGELSEGHGRALLAAGDAKTICVLARQAVEGGWSVRETETRARDQREAKSASGSSASDGSHGDSKKSSSAKSPNVRDLERRLSNTFAAKVELKEKSKGRGALVLHFENYDELDRIVARMLR